MTAVQDRAVGMAELSQMADSSASVPDCTLFAPTWSRRNRALLLVGGALFGVLVGATGGALMGAQTSLWLPMGLLALAGGLLSTWSPCGYSSLSLLRPDGRGTHAVLRFLPTLATHAAGYAVGAVILGAILGGIGALLGADGWTGTAALLVLGGIGIVYGLHQLDFLRVPYPQRRAQVPHDARQRFPKWFIGGLYGLALGLDYLTYVQTPLLYLITAAAVLTGHPVEAILLIAVFNLGRFLPMLVNLLPVTDQSVQLWLARHQERAAMADGALLVAAGVLLSVLAMR